MAKMKVAEFLSSKQVRISERPIPEPADDQVLIKVKYAGICGTDLKIYDGSITYAKTGLLKYPIIPGHEWSGEVVRVGPKVQAYKPGDRVTGECHIGCGKCADCLGGRYNICKNRIRVGIVGHDGAFAEYVIIPEKALHLLPSQVSYMEAALVEPLTIALHAMDKFTNVAGSRVLVFGLGPIGMLISQVARAMGAGQVIGVDLVQFRLDMGKRLGCDVVTNKSSEELVKEVEELTSGQGVDIVVEAAGVKPLIPLATRLVRHGGQICLVGLYDGNVEINAAEIINKDLRVYGNMASARVWDRAIQMIAGGRVDVRSMVTHQFSLEQTPEAMEIAYDKEIPTMKVLLQME